MKNWFSVSNRVNGVADISIHDEIGMYGISAKEFINDLQNINAEVINLSIHSPGGSVTDGFAMYNAILNHPAKIHGRVEGIAASAASFILMAADDITMPEDSFLMIHNAWGGAMGDAKELRKAAEIIDKLQDNIVNIYIKRSNLDEIEIRGMMDEESWISAREAMEYGFIDSIDEPIKVAAKIQEFNKHFKEMPINNQADDIANINSLKDCEKYLRDAGSFSRKQATALVSKIKESLQCDTGNDLDQANAALTNLCSKFNSIK